MLAVFRSSLVALMLLAAVQFVSSEPLGASASARAREIKRAPAYYDRGERKSANWLSRGVQSLIEYVRKLLDRNRLDPSISAPKVGKMDWLVMGVWALLGLAVAGGLYFALRHFKWFKQSRAPTSALMDDDEPLRASNEWLAEADRLRAEGREREAVRCLFLGCLVRLDEVGRLRFARTETNWEHVRRWERTLEKAPDLRALSRRFDRAWYGHEVHADDYETFLNAMVLVEQAVPTGVAG